MFSLHLAIWPLHLINPYPQLLNLSLCLYLSPLIGKIHFLLDPSLLHCQFLNNLSELIHLRVLVLDLLLLHIKLMVQRLLCFVQIFLEINYLLFTSLQSLLISSGRFLSLN